MEKFAVVLVCVAVVIGLLGGFGLGLVVYEPQLQSVKDAVAELNSIVATMENRSWHEVYSIEASEDITSNTFHLKGKDVRVTWIFVSRDPTAELTVYLYFANGTAYGWWGDSGTWSVDNAELELAKSGNYYVSISSSGIISYYVAVHDYY